MNVKENLEKFLATIGWQAAALEPVTNEDDGDPADGDTADDLPEDDQPEGDPEPKRNTDPKSVNLPKNELPENLSQLNQLVEEVGGIETLRSILVGSAALVVGNQNREQNERAALVETIVANSEEFTKEELKDVGLPFLRKLADTTTPRIPTNFAMLGSQHNADAKDKVAVRPSFLVNKKKEE